MTLDGRVASVGSIPVVGAVPRSEGDGYFNDYLNPSPSSSLGLYVFALVFQLAEKAHLKCVQCGFESHPGHFGHMIASIWFQAMILIRPIRLLNERDDDPNRGLWGFESDLKPLRGFGRAMVDLP